MECVCVRWQVPAHRPPPLLSFLCVSYCSLLVACAQQANGASPPLLDVGPLTQGTRWSPCLPRSEHVFRFLWCSLFPPPPPPPLSLHSPCKSILHLQEKKVLTSLLGRRHSFISFFSLCVTHSSGVFQQKKYPTVTTLHGEGQSSLLPLTWRTAGSTPWRWHCTVPCLSCTAPQSRAPGRGQGLGPSGRTAGTAAADPHAGPGSSRP